MARGISRGARKLARTPTLIFLKKPYFIYLLVLLSHALHVYK